MTDRQVPAEGSGEPTFEADLRRRLTAAQDGASGDAEPLHRAVLAWRGAEAVEEAKAWDALARRGVRPALAGTVLSVKANIDVAGWVTTAGSRVLAGEPPATADAPVVAALRRAGAVVLTQTTMVEFAYGALGLNVQPGTPYSPLFPAGERVAGGSSSGAAVAVALGLTDAAVCTDTSGSARIPAAFCGVTGFKPTHGRYPTADIVPLAPSQDSVGLLARSAGLCDRLDAVLAGRVADSDAGVLAGARFAVPSSFVESVSDSETLMPFHRVLAALADAGAVVEDTTLGYLTKLGEITRAGGIVAAEALVWHRTLLKPREALYDPHIHQRIAAGAAVLAVDYLRARDALAQLAVQWTEDLSGFDGLLTPTVPFAPPKLCDLGEPSVRTAANLRAFTFTEVANRLGLPSLSLPVGRSGIGLMLTGHRDDDASLLRRGRQIECALTAAGLTETT